MPLARCTGCAGFLRLTDWAAVKPPSDSSLRVCPSSRALPSLTPPTGRSRRTPLMDFRSLQHLQDSAIHSSRAFQARYGPRSGFGYPLRGFRPPNPGRLCFTPAALVGFALRSVLLRHGHRSVSARFAPTCRFAPSVNAPHGAGGRPDGPRLLGFVPRQSPLRPASV